MTSILAAAGFRTGVVGHLVDVPFEPCDPPGLFNAAIDPGPANRSTPAGGIGRTLLAAQTSAVGEAVERYCAAAAALPSPPTGTPRLALSDWTLHDRRARRDPANPHGEFYRSWRRGTLEHTLVWHLGDNAPAAAPAALVGLSSDRPSPATSSGLACGPSITYASLRALQELVERDAFMVSWLHQVEIPSCPLPERYAAELDGLQWSARVYDMTPFYSPHRVIGVGGWITRKGRRRVSFGLACRSSATDALEKAYLEWVQGVIFTGRVPSEPVSVPRTFDEHASWYSHHPEIWDCLPFHSGPRLDLKQVPVPDSGPTQDRQRRELVDLVAGVERLGSRVFYRDLTTPDAAQLGARVVRILAPGLVPIHANHAWPNLGGTAGDVAGRFPAMRSQPWPVRYPHPLG